MIVIVVRSVTKDMVDDGSQISFNLADFHFHLDFVYSCYYDRFGRYRCTGLYGGVSLVSSSLSKFLQSASPLGSR